MAVLTRNHGWAQLLVFVLTLTITARVSLGADAASGTDRAAYDAAVSEAIDYLLTKGEAADGSYTRGPGALSRRLQLPRSCPTAVRPTIRRSPRA